MDKELYTLLIDEDGFIDEADFKVSLIALFDEALERMPTATPDDLSAVARLRAQVAIHLANF